MNRAMMGFDVMVGERKLGSVIEREDGTWRGLNNSRKPIGDFSRPPEAHEAVVAAAQRRAERSRANGR